MKAVPDYKRRLAVLEGEIENRKLDSFLVTNETNVSYLSGFLGHDAVLLVAGKKKFFLTDSRYIEEAEEVVTGFQVHLVKTSTYVALKDLIKKNNLHRVGFESMNLPYEVALRLKGLLGKSELVPVKSLIESQRAVKDACEVKLIRNSIRLTRSVLDVIIKLIKPGMREDFLAREIELEFIKRRALPAFEPIVASGANSSKPHSRPTASAISKNVPVMVDLGCRLEGYSSDLTRMVFLGRVKDKFKKIYKIISVAQKRAIDMVRPGARIADVDLAARGYIRDQGFGRYFGHSLGHGVGMEVHEEPTISRLNESLLQTGTVFTVEPAIYIPKFGGVRIEDIVLVTDRGCEVLTR